MHQDNVAFARGQTHYNGQTIDTTNYGNSVALEGVIHEFPVLDPTVTALQARRDGNVVKMICVRNVSGITIPPCRVCIWAVGYEGRRVDGLARLASSATQMNAGVSDDQLPSAGVVNGDLFWIAIKGKHLVKTGNVISSILVGDYVVAATAASTQGTTTAGRCDMSDFNQATTSLALAIKNTIGRALTARTTNNTADGVNCLIDLDIH